MSKHTPGEWFAKKTAGDHDQYLIYPESGETVSIVNGEANAELIAAAPDLLEALELLLKADDDICENRGSKSDQAMLRIAAIDAARAAIAKAQPTNAD